MTPQRDIPSRILTNFYCLLGALPFLAWFIWLAVSDPMKETRILWMCASAFVLSLSLLAIYDSWRPSFSRKKKYSRLEILFIAILLTAGSLSPAGFRAVTTHSQRIAYADSRNVNERLVGVAYQLDRLNPTSEVYRDLVTENLDHSHFEVRKEVLVHLLGVKNSVRKPFLPTIRTMEQNDHSEAVKTWAKLVLQAAEHNLD